MVNNIGVNNAGGMMEKQIVIGLESMIAEVISTTDVSI